MKNKTNKQKKTLKKRNCELTQLTNIWLHWISFCISKITVSSTVDGQSTIFQYLLIFHTEGEGEGGTDWQGSTGVYTRPCIGEIAGGKRPCNTGNSAWCCVRPTRWGRGGRLRREEMYLHSHCRTQKPTQRCRAIILQLKLRSKTPDD